MTMHLRELQVQIDDIYGCHGNCPGCVLTSSEKKATTPSMSAETLALVASRIGEYVSHLGQLDRLNITFAVADHLMLEDDYFGHIYETGARLIEAANPTDRSHSGVFFSTSMIGKREQILPRMEKFAALAAGRPPFMPVVVLDPALLYSAKFGPIYEDMILRSRELFGQIDLSINLSDEAVRRMPPQALHDFAADNGFSEVTINWTPTPFNKEHTTKDLEFLARWMIEFDHCLETAGRISSSFRPVLLRTIHAVMCAASNGETSSIAGTIRNMVPKTIRHSIEFDHLGNVLPKFEAIGDVPHSERFGLKPLGHIREGSIAEIMDKALPGVLQRIQQAHIRSRACMGCRYAPICAATGFHVTNLVLMRDRGRDPFCPHVARALFDHFYPIAEAERV
jgi:hypothetical protein